MTSDNISVHTGRAASRAVQQAGAHGTGAAGRPELGRPAMLGETSMATTALAGALTATGDNGNLSLSWASPTTA